MLFSPSLCCLFAATTLLSITQVAPPDWDTLPTDISTSARGVAALAVDPGSGLIDQGAQLQLRYVDTAGARLTHALRLAGGGAVGPVSLAAMYSWQNLPDPRAGRGLVQVGLRLQEYLRLGLAWQRLQPDSAPQTRDVVDVGAAWEPHPVLALSAGVDALNAPHWPRAQGMRRALRLGVGLRPLYGDARLTLAADVRLTHAGRWAAPDARVGVDVMPTQGLHLVAAWRHTQAAETVWAGLALHWGGLSVMGAGRTGSAAPQAPSARAPRYALALTQTTAPSRGLATRSQHTVHLRLEGNLVADAGAPWRPTEAVSLLPAHLQRLARMGEVSRVVLDVGALDGGEALVDELRTSIHALMAQGIEVHAHLMSEQAEAYEVAAAAQRVTLDPVGTLDVRGVALTQYFYAQALHRFGVRFEAVGIGRYKSAPDRFTADGPRPEDVQVLTGLAQTRYQRRLAILTHDRHLSEDAAHSALAAGPLSAARAQALGLVDGVSPAPPSLTPRAPGRSQLKDPLFDPPEDRWGVVPRIAVVPIVGTLAVDPDAWALGGAQVMAREVVQALARAQDDSAVVGVVVRIDSPGGDVQAAEEVYRAVSTLAQFKPVAVSMGEVAASGGYWAALGATRVFAQPSTLTGSIGIFRLQPDLSELVGRLGVGRHAITCGERAGEGSLFTPMSADEVVRQRAHLMTLYQQFTGRVARARALTAARTEELAQGRVFTGAEALEVGLIDALGGLFEALSWVQQAAGVPEERAVRWQVSARQTSITANIIRALNPVGRAALGSELVATEDMLGWPQNPQATLRALAALQHRTLALMAAP